MSMRPAGGSAAAIAGQKMRLQTVQGETEGDLEMARLKLELEVAIAHGNWPEKQFCRSK